MSYEEFFNGRKVKDIPPDEPKHIRERKVRALRMALLELFESPPARLPPRDRALFAEFLAEQLYRDRNQLDGYLERG